MWKFLWSVEEARLPRAMEGVITEKACEGRSLSPPEKTEPESIEPIFD